MKKLISFIIIFAVLLSGCVARPLAPIYDQAPTATEQAITIEGKTLSGVYSDGETEYLRLQEFADALGGAVEITEQENSFAATFSLGEKSVVFTEGKRYDGEQWYQPKEDLMPLLEGYHPFEDAEQNHTYYTAYPMADGVQEGIDVPILMYHAVSDDCWGIPALFVSPKKLEEQLQYLQENGYTTVTFEDFDRLGQIEKPVMLTFDDGYSDNYTELFPILQKYQAKATIFLIYDKLDQLPYYLTREQIKEMDASGLVSFQSHTMTHRDLDTLNEQEQQYELAQAKLELTRLLGKEVFVIAYPTGKWDENTLKITKEQYQFGLLSRGQRYETGRDRAKVSRYYVSRYTTLSEFIDMID